jgi:hypothetical protein
MSAQRERAYIGRAEDVHRANDRIAEKAEHLRFVARVPFLCECPDEECETLVLLSLADYHAARAAHRPLLAPGH